MSKALSLYKEFNNKSARGFSTREISLTKELVDLGSCVAVAYASSKEGKKQHYEHKFGKGARLLSTDNGRTLLIVGANIRVTDWIRG